VDETKSFTFGTRSYASFSQAQFGGRDVETSKDELVLLLRTRASSGLLALLVAGKTMTPKIVEKPASICIQPAPALNCMVAGLVFYS